MASDSKIHSETCVVNKIVGFCHVCFIFKSIRRYTLRLYAEGIYVPGDLAKESNGPFKLFPTFLERNNGVHVIIMKSPRSSRLFGYVFI
jgi:hypothetical protein